MTNQPATLGGLLHDSDSAGLVGHHGLIPLADVRDRAYGAARRLAADVAPLLLLLRNDVADVVVLLGAAIAGRRVVLCDPEVSPEGLAAICGELGVPRALVCGSRDLLGRHHATNGAQLAVEDVASGGSERPQPAPRPHAPFAHLLTSGSTGKQRLAVHDQSSLVRGALMYRTLYPRQTGEAMVLPVPLVHSFGLIGGLLHGLAIGATVVLLPRFTPAAFTTAVAEHRAAICLGTPLLFQLLLRSRAMPELDHRCLALCSGGPLSAEQQTQLATTCRLDVRQVYGSTEAGLIAAQPPAGAEPGTVGPAAPGVQARLEDGELVVRTPGMFLGYSGQLTHTERWYRTGDQAEIEPGGTIRILGRKDTFINVGGKKVNPARVEAVLESHDCVEEALVLPRGAHAEQQAVAQVVVSGPVSDAELSAWCRDQLLAYEVPASYDRVPRLPRTSTGKLRRTKVAP